MNKEFERFKKEFQRWQDKFGLNGYKVYFKYKPLEDCFANIIVNGLDHVAIVTLSSITPEKDKAFKDVRRSAKHEALHLFCNRLETCARDRYTSPDEINRAGEELAFKLDRLIQ